MNVTWYVNLDRREDHRDSSVRLVAEWDDGKGRDGGMSFASVPREAVTVEYVEQCEKAVARFVALFSEPVEYGAA